MIKIGLHGEAALVKIDVLPEDAVKLPHNGDLIIAASETVGHHHRIYCEQKQATLYERDGMLYLKVEEPVEVSCKGKHDTETLSPGVWFVDKQQEWDYINDMAQAVAD